jgi:hypothetical protein
VLYREWTLHDNPTVAADPVNDVGDFLYCPEEMLRRMYSQVFRRSLFLKTECIPALPMNLIALLGMISMMSTVKRMRALLVSLLCTGSVFSFPSTGVSQTVPSALSGLVQQTITNSVAATIAFTSTDAISTGSFAFHEGDARGESRFSITRVPFRHFFGKEKDGRLPCS